MEQEVLKLILNKLDNIEKDQQEMKVTGDGSTDTFFFSLFSPTP